MGHNNVRKEKAMWFEVELKRESYVVLTVEADNPAEAEEKAWRELEESGGFGGDASWSVESIEDVEVRE